MTFKSVLLAGGLAMCLAGCAVTSTDSGGANFGTLAAPKTQSALDAVAADYIRLTLEAGTHEAEWVDAYYGPAELQAKAKANPRSLAVLREDVEAQIDWVDNQLLQNWTGTNTKRRLKALRGMLVAADGLA